MADNDAQVRNFATIIKYLPRLLSIAATNSASGLEAETSMRTRYIH